MQIKTKQTLAFGLSAACALYGLFYLANGIYSGDHWKFAETIAGFFVSALIIYWALNFDSTPAQKTIARTKIKKILIIAFLVVAAIIGGWLTLIGIVLGLSG